MLTKDQAAEELAEAHYAIDSGLRAIYRLVADNEEDPGEPIKLLEVNEDTLPAGIVPLVFGAKPARNVPYPYIVAEVTPDEFQQVQQWLLELPHGWRLGRSYARPALTESAA